MTQRKRRPLIGGIICLLCLPALLLGCGQTPQGPVPAGMQDATPAGADYTLFLPDGWQIDRRGGMTVASYASYTSASITFTDFDSEKEPAAYWAASQAETAAKFTEYQVTEDGKNTAMGGKPALRYSFKGTYHDGAVWRGMQCIAKQNDRLYVLTYTAKDAEFDTYLPGVNTVLDEFLFTGAGQKTEETAPVTEGAPPGMKQIGNDAIHAFRFYVPLTWQTDLQDGGCVSAYVSDDDRSSVSLVAHYPPSGVSHVVDYFLAEEGARKSLLSDYHLISGAQTMEELENDPTVQAPVGKAFGARYVYEGVNGGVTYRICQVFFVHGAQIYTYTYTAEASLYDTHIAEAEAILAALTFEK